MSPAALTRQNSVDPGQRPTDTQSGSANWRVLILCALVTLIDGYDIQAMASATPSLAADWHVAPGDLRWIVTAALIGIAGSALIVSPLGDYFGRRTVLLASFGLVAVATIIAATTHTPLQLFTWRLLTGIGLGASLPNALALTAEFASARNRTAIVALIGCGIALGAALSGLAAPSLIALGSWRAVFAAGGFIAALAWFPLFLLPESAGLKLARHTRLPVSELLQARRAPATVLLWLVFFFNLGLLHLLASWLPTMLKESGLPLAQSLRIAAMFQIGGVLGGFVLAWLMRRWGTYLVLGVSYALTALALAAISAKLSDPVLTALLILIMGNGVVGGQAALNALAATLYPTTSRATGVGWALGIGRLGAIVAPLIVGQLMAAGTAIGHVFSLAVIPALICTIAVTLLRAAVNRSRTTVSVSAP